MNEKEKILHKLLSTRTTCEYDRSKPVAQSIATQKDTKKMKKREKKTNTHIRVTFILG